MNEYWVMYEDGDDYGLTVIPFATGGEVTTFIEEKLQLLLRKSSTSMPIARQISG